MFATKLKEIMALRDMTAADLARATGLTNAALSGMLSGQKADPKLSTSGGGMRISVCLSFSNLV